MFYLILLIEWLSNLNLFESLDYNTNKRQKKLIHINFLQNYIKCYSVFLQLIKNNFY
jgi:hypothetical protein